MHYYCPFCLEHLSGWIGEVEHYRAAHPMQLEETNQGPFSTEWKVSGGIPFQHGLWWHNKTGITIEAEQQWFWFIHGGTNGHVLPALPEATQGKAP